MNRKALFTFLGLAFGIAWLIWIICIYVIGGPALMTISAAVCMWTPALALFITDRIHHLEIPWKKILKPEIKKNLKIYLFAWFIPLILTIAGMIVYFIVFRNQYDPDLEYAGLLAMQSGTDITGSLIILITVIQAITYAPVLNSLLAVGEELGWRGFLYPELRKKYTPMQASLLVGLIWGIWHTPVNMAGHNYGVLYPTWPFGGIIAMCLFCFSLAILLSWVYAKSGSIWTASILHGAVNAISNLPVFFQKTDYIQKSWVLFGPALNGLIAGLPALILALVFLRKNGDVM